MRPCSTALNNYFNDATKQDVVVIDLYTFLLTTGEVFRWANGQTVVLPAAAFPTGSVNFGSNQTFVVGPQFGRSKVSTKVGVEATELDLEVHATYGVASQVGNFTFSDATRLGLFDGATVELDRFFTPPSTTGYTTLDTSLGCLIWFYGRVADSSVGRSKTTIKVRSMMNLLANQQMPRRLFTSGCNHVFGDMMCGYDRVNGKNAAGASTGIGQITVVAAGGSTQQLINLTTSPSSESYTLGTIIGYLGANQGYRRSVSTVVGSLVSVIKPFFYPVKPGDQFYLLPGCPHTLTACGLRNNQARYGGFPFIPPPEFAF